MKIKHASQVAISVMTTILLSACSGPNGFSEFKNHLKIANVPDQPQIFKEDGSVINSEGIDYGKKYSTFFNPDIDPYQHLNRVGFYINYDILDRYFLRPLAVLNNLIISSDLSNALFSADAFINEPFELASNVATGQGKAAGRNIIRFAFNGLFGFGLLDWASEFGVYQNGNNLNYVLAHYGVKTGNYLHLPVLGPTDSRELLSYYLIQKYLEASAINYAVPQVSFITTPLSAYKIIALRSTLIDQEGLVLNNPDPYVVVRSVWGQNQNFSQSKALDTEQPTQTEPAFDPSLLVN